jgi:hypothetical protein
VVARHRPVATHAPVGAVPMALILFFLILNVMAARPPRSVTSLR